MNFWLTEPAREDLLDIWEFTATQWDVAQADRYIEALEARFAWLTQHPGLWKPRPDIRPGIYTCTEQSHVIVFRKRNGDIEILRVLHGRMDPGRHA